MAAIGQGGGRGPAVTGRQGQNGDIDAGRVDCGTATNLDSVTPLPDQGLDPAWITVHDHYAVKGGIIGENAPGPPTDRSQAHQGSLHSPTRLNRARLRVAPANHRAAGVCRRFPASAQCQR